MKNCPEYYELLFACWHAGLDARADERQAARQGVRLHPRELRREGLLRDRAISQQDVAKRHCHHRDGKSAADEATPAEVAARRRRRGSSIRAARPACRRGRCSRIATCCSRRRPTSPTSTSSSPSDSILHPAPLSHGSGFYGAAALRRRRGERHPGERPASSRRRSSSSSITGTARPSSPRRRWSCGCSRARRRARRASLKTHHLRRRADVRRRLPARHRAFRPAPLPALRPGRERR